jgi:uncharacterized protein with HEPN domain
MSWNATPSASPKHPATSPEDLKARHPSISWRLVADLGNVLRHAYDQVVDERIWQIVSQDLGPLKAAVEAMLPAAQKNAPDRG